MTRTRFIFAALLLVSLSACGGNGGGIFGTKQTPQSVVYAARGSYDATVLAPAAHYASLPRCAPNASATLSAPCSDAAVVAQLQKADHAAEIALDAAESQVRNFPTIDATAAIAAAQNAITAATQILTLYSVH
jgi:hypothetical protein